MMRLFHFRSVFVRLFVSVMLALIFFAMAMILLAQVVQDNSTTIKSEAIADQIVTQVDPFLMETQDAPDLLRARIMLAVIKKSFDIFDESLDAKIGLYGHHDQLILQTENSNLPDKLPSKPSWFSKVIPAFFGNNISPQVQVASHTGFTLLYEPRNPPPPSKFTTIINLFSGTLLLLIIMSIVLWLISRSITWRINQMSGQMLQLGEGDFSARVPVHGNDEIATLARGFNQSAEKIEKLIDANNLLLAHASHELRTPITRIRLQIEMMDILANQLTREDKKMFDKRANAINKDLSGLNDLVESILLVSRLDAGHALQRLERLDLYELIVQETQHYNEASFNGEHVIVEGQPKLLTHLIRNLLNNAMIHGTPPVQVYLYGIESFKDANLIPEFLTTKTYDVDSNTNTDVMTDSLSVNNTDKKSIKANKLLIKTNERLFKKKELNKPIEPIHQYAVLAVIDKGNGIPVEKRQDIFSPFVRLKQEKKGSGLGLSLVAQIVEAHNGHISTDTWKGHTRFLVVLPIKQQTVTT